MRSVLLIVAPLLLIVCGFVIYSQMQGPATPRAVKLVAKGPTTIPTGDGSTTRPVVGAGDDAWVERYDQKGELASRFRAARYEPQPDDTLLVDHPVAEFMLGRGRVARIEGRRGSVIMPAPKVAERGEIQGPPTQMPNRGQLHDVLISLFETEPVEGEESRPAMTVTMNNASFDNDTFLIRTDAFLDEAGKRVDADQVPVKVRGDDYDFDGRGLTLQWNDLEQKLQLLEIAHGESLTVKNPGRLDEMQGAGDRSLPATPVASDASAAGIAPATSPPGTPPTSQAAAARAKKKKRKTPAPATSPVPRPPTPYRANFERDLRITEGVQETASGDLLQVDFMPDDTGDGAQPTTAPSDSAPTIRRKPRRRNAATPSTHAIVADGTPPVTHAAAIEPIVIRWSGRLRIVPLDSSADSALGPGEQVVRLSGAPLRLLRDSATIEAAGAIYRSGDGTVNLRSSDEVARVTLRDAKGALVSTPGLIYFEAAETATLTGPSSAEIPTGSGDARQTLSATWSDECLLSLPRDERGDTMIRQAKIKGAVAISHPRMDLNSDELELLFSATTTKNAPTPRDADGHGLGDTPELEKLIATGSVLARLKDASTAERTIQAHRLEMQTSLTPSGHLLPRTIIADGEVVLSEPTQSMRADHVEAKLAPKPTTGPSPNTTPTTTRAASDVAELIVESVVAQGGVRLTGQKGSFATAEQLQAFEKEGAGEVKLMGGGAAAPAIVSDGKNTITGQVLKLLPRDEMAEVPGDGTLTFVREDPDGRASPPVNVTWAGHAALDGKANRVDLHQGVSFTSIGADGMTITSNSDHLELLLIDKPPTQPEAQPATQLSATTTTTTQPAIEDASQSGGQASTQIPTRPATRPIDPPATRSSAAGLGNLKGIDFLADKDPRSAKLSGDVRIESTLLGVDRAVERRMYLSTTEANYDMASRHMIVPVGGRLLYEDHRPLQPKEGEAPADNANRGTTAFEWKKRLTYDDPGERVVMEGDVDINHVPDDQKSPSFRIATQRVVAELMPKPTSQPVTVPTTAPATAPTTTRSGPLPSALQLKRVIAEGGVAVTAKRFSFTATTLSYNPIDGLLTAHGSDDQPISFTDEQGQGEGSVESLTWNTKTDQIALKRARGRVRP